jgi:integral membrane protein
MSAEVRRFRAVAMLEGVSYLLLLLVAMPLKYAAGWPLGVKLVGAAHGVLFVAYVFTLAQAASAHGWGARRAGVAMLASLLPLGAFWLDRKLRPGAGWPGAA